MSVLSIASVLKSNKPKWIQSSKTRLLKHAAHGPNAARDGISCGPRCFLEFLNKHGLPQKFVQGGQRRRFANRFQLADVAIQMEVH